MSALTRAEDRLVICGWQTRRGVADESWWSSVQRGFHAIGARAEPFEGWDGEVLVAECPQTRPPLPGHGATPSALTPLPAWAGQPGDWRPAPPPAEPALPVPLAPSRPDDAALGPVPAARSPRRGPGSDSQDRFRRGNLDPRAAAAPPLAPARSPRTRRPRPPPPQRTRRGRGHHPRHRSARRARPSRAPTAVRPGRPRRAAAHRPSRRRSHHRQGRPARRAPGRGPARRLQDRPPAPAAPGATPVLYLRQLASYRAVLQSIYPDRPVRCALVWTEGPTVVELPPALLDAHAPAA